MRVVKGLVVALFVWGVVWPVLLGIILDAQAPPTRPVVATALPVPTPAPAPSVPPAYTETERLMVQLVQVSDQLATCQQALGQKNVVSLSLTVQQRIEQAHPGYTVNWQTGALIPLTPKVPAK